MEAFVVQVEFSAEPWKLWGEHDGDGRKGYDYIRVLED